MLRPAEELLVSSRVSIPPLSLLPPHGSKGGKIRGHNMLFSVSKFPPTGACECFRETGEGKYVRAHARQVFFCVYFLSHTHDDVLLLPQRAPQSKLQYSTVRKSCGLERTDEIILKTGHSPVRTRWLYNLLSAPCPASPNTLHSPQVPPIVPPVGGQVGHDSLSQIIWPPPVLQPNYPTVPFPQQKIPHGSFTASTQPELPPCRDAKMTKDDD